MGLLQKKGFIAGVKDALPTALGYISIGLAFGIVAAAANLSALEVGLMSLLVYGGSAQFAMVAMFVAQADLVTITMTVFFINLRNMLMSLHATTIFTETSFWNSMGIASLITDESYGVLLGENIHNKNISDNWMHGNNLFSYFAWVVSTIIGTLLGNIIPNPESFGLDFALIAMFIGLWIDQVASMLSEGAKKLILILLAVAISYVVLVTVVSESLAVLLATLIGCGVGVILDGYY